MTCYRNVQERLRVLDGQNPYPEKATGTDKTAWGTATRNPSGRPHFFLQGGDVNFSLLKEKLTSMIIFLGRR
jgi:hypothetical protein